MVVAHSGFWPIASFVAAGHFVSNRGQTGHIADLAETK